MTVAALHNQKSTSDTSIIFAVHCCIASLLLSNITFLWFCMALN